MQQPIAKPAPDRLASRECRVIGTIRSEAFPLFLQEAALEEVLDYSEQEATREIGGFLIGGVYADRGLYVEIAKFLPAAETRSRAASLTFTHATWSAMTQQVQQRHPGQQVVGWHHTHPHLGVFLSAHDRFIHRHFFSQPWQVAMVVDPQRGEFGFFQWCGQDIVDCGFLCVSAASGGAGGAAADAG